MTTSLISLSEPTATDLPSHPATDPCAWLTDDDAARIAAALAATCAASTRKVYAFAWGRWMRWCSGRGIMSFPAEPAAVCAYLTECAEQRLSLATIDSACSAIAHQHRSHGVSDPIAHDAVRQVRRGLRRIIGRAPRRPARPLSVAELRQIVAAIDRATDRGVRDTALLLLGFAGALRRTELAALTLADLEAKPGGLLLHLRRSKTDQEARGQVVGIAHGQHPLTDPIAALDAWLALRGTAPGPVFTSLRPGGPPLRPLSGNAVSTLVKERALAAGLSGGRISGHSLRAGHATSAALAGVGVDRIAAQTRHRRIDILIDRYIRPVQALQTTSGRDLGL
ncbi:tyrosine-type recombinase/integrase [Intrasporangium sp.]|uniref:tyrosine-type recombinase/integrase n=1 Tax=Intrasporangium sp. TaxID=1925024 RepID=UPI0033654E79